MTIHATKYSFIKNSQIIFRKVLSEIDQIHYADYRILKLKVVLKLEHFPKNPPLFTTSHRVPCQKAVTITVSGVRNSTLTDFISFLTSREIT